MTSLPKLRPRSVVAFLAAMALVLSACGGDDPSVESPGSVSTETPTVSTTSTPTATETSTTDTTTAPEEPTGMQLVNVYFANAEGKLVEESRSIPGAADVRSALVALSTGPDTAGAVAALPAGTEVVGTAVEGGIALINFNMAFQDGYPSGGAAAEFAVLAPIVYTATGIDGVERVRITVDGQTPSPVGSQYDWSGSFSRADFPDVEASP